MEVNDIFSIETLANENGALHVRAAIDKNHWVYKAHFPEKPITPGAVILHTLQNIVCQALSKNYKIALIKSVRFMVPVEPDKVECMDFNVEIFQESEDSVVAKCLVTSGDIKFSKINVKLTTFL